MSAPPSPTSTGVPTQKEQELNLQPDKLSSISSPLTASISTTSNNLITRTLAPFLNCLPPSRHKSRKPRSTSNPSAQPSKQLPYAPNAAPPTLHFPTLSCPYLLNSPTQKYSFPNPAPSHTSILSPVPPKDPAYIPHHPHQTPTPKLHLRGGSSSHRSASSNPASSPPDAPDEPDAPPANRKGRKGLADDERAPAMLWWFAGGRSFPPPTGKQLREGKRLVREREKVKAEKRAAKKGKGGGGLLGRLLGGGKAGKGKGKGGADEDASGGVGGGGSSHRGPS
ncbi:MAG: hypothetical protein M1836_003921 [Candelina mexicana]|nr:MAG: hypothetical protein M1836_003921 [Candelina mexicana]